MNMSVALLVELKTSFAYLEMAVSRNKLQMAMVTTSNPGKVKRSGPADTRHQPAVIAKAVGPFRRAERRERRGASVGFAMLRPTILARPPSPPAGSREPDNRREST